MHIVETLLQLDLEVDSPSENIRSLRAAIGYIQIPVNRDNISSEVYMVVYGYGGGGMQESSSYKIQETNIGEYIIYRGFINPDEWETKFYNNIEEENCESLNANEQSFFNSIERELSRYLINESEVLDEDIDINMLPKSEYIDQGEDFLISENFDTS